MVGNGRVCREGGTKMRDVGGRGLGEGRRLLWWRATYLHSENKGCGPCCVCVYVCLPLISRNEGRREADQKSFPAFFVVPRLNRASLCSRF